MTGLAEVVFSITPAGYTALRNTTEPMDLRLKTVLTLVDGVCPVAQYVPYLMAFDPLSEKFFILERMGYVRRLGRIASSAVSGFQESIRVGTSKSRLPRIDTESKESGFMPSV